MLIACNVFLFRLLIRKSCDIFFFRSYLLSFYVKDTFFIYIYIYIYMGEKKTQINYKFIPTSLFRGRPLIRGFHPLMISSPDECATTKQACRDELVVYLCFFLSHIYFALLPCIEHCFTNIKFTLYIYIYIYIYTHMKKVSFT